MEGDAETTSMPDGLGQAERTYWRRHPDAPGSIVMEGHFPQAACTLWGNTTICTTPSIGPDRGELLAPLEIVSLL